MWANLSAIAATMWIILFNILIFPNVILSFETNQNFNTAVIHETTTFRRKEISASFSNVFVFFISPNVQTSHCIDCMTSFENCSSDEQKQFSDLEVESEDPCCRELCLNKSHWKTPIDGKLYKILSRVEIDGKNTSICLCLEDVDAEYGIDGVTPEVQHTSPEFQPSPIQMKNEPCMIKCEGVDEFGTIWEECGGRVKTKSCPGNGIGSATWYCAQNGSFENEAPDFHNCKSKWLTELENGLSGRDKLSLNGAENILDKTLWQLNEPKRTYFPHEVEPIVTLVGKVGGTNETDLTKLESLTGKLVRVCDEILIQLQVQPKDKQDGSRKATKLLTTLEGNVLGLSKTSIWSSKQIRPGEKNYEKAFSDLTSFRITTGALEKSGKLTKSEFLGWDPSDKELSSVSLPNGWQNQLSGTHALYVGIKIKDKHVKNLFPDTLGGAQPRGQISVINGPILSLSVSNPEAEIFPIRFEGAGARMTFYHDIPASIGHSDPRLMRKLYPGEKPKAISETSTCVHWDTNHLVWSQVGCRLVETHESYTVCECEHLTAFAVLMDIHNYVGKDVGLITLTFLLCIISCVFLLISIIIFAKFRSAQSPRTSITIHLCTCLLIGNLLVLTVMDRNNFNMSPGMCGASAILTHYIFLSAFAWMGIEGFVVYKMLVHVFESGTDNKRLLNAIAYGSPFLLVLIFVVVHAASNDPVYGGELYCWLIGGYIWSFIAPVFTIVAGNIVVMLIALTKVYQLNHSTLQVKKRAKSYKTWIFGSLSLTFLLGLTWIFGALLFIPNAKVANVAAYLFTIFNASQGYFIFFFHCWMNENVRVALSRKLGYPSSGFSTQNEKDKGRTEVRMSAPVTTTTSTCAHASKAEDACVDEDVDAEPPTEEDIFNVNEEKRRKMSECSETSETGRKPAFLRYLESRRMAGKYVDENGFM